MQADAPAAGNTSILDPIPDNLFREPVDYLFADHVRQRALCRLLTAVSARDAVGADTPLEATLAFLETDHPDHMADEDEELFPRLREQCAGNKELLRLLDDLEVEHRREIALGQHIVDALRRMTADAGKPVTEDLRTSIDTFVADVMNHLAVEDARVLPLARTSLSDADLEEMGRAMARRRGVDYPC